MKTFKFSLVLRTRENTNVFITLDDNIYGIHSKRVSILYLFYKHCADVTANRNDSRRVALTQNLFFDVDDDTSGLVPALLFLFEINLYTNRWKSLLLYVML